MKTFIIGIAGGTGAGKSTFTNRLISVFQDKISVIYYDSYYKKHDDIPLECRALINYDHPDAFETDLLVEHILQLKNGNQIKSPVYDFAIHDRLPAQTKNINPSHVILVEGILTFYDERIRNLLDLKIFIDIDADVRILRRIVRDVNERGRDLNGVTSQYLATVKEMHSKYVEPTKMMADIIINDSLNVPVFDLIKVKIESILSEK